MDPTASYKSAGLSIKANGSYILAIAYYSRERSFGLGIPSNEQVLEEYYTNT